MGLFPELDAVHPQGCVSRSSLGSCIPAATAAHCWHGSSCRSLIWLLPHTRHAQHQLHLMVFLRAQREVFQQRMAFLKNTG